MIAIADFGNKGGVGKTTTTVNLAHGIALGNPDLKIGYWDTDGQLSGMTLLGVDATDLPGYASVINKENDIEDVLVEVRPNLFAFFMEVNKYNKTEKSIGLESNPYKVFKRPLEKLKQMDFDILFIDCGPGQTYMNGWIMEYVDHIFLIAQLKEAAISGVATAIGFLDEMDVELDKIDLIIPNMHNATKKSSDEHIAKLHVDFKDKVSIANYISEYEAIEKSWQDGKTIWEYEKDEKALKLQDQYTQLIEKVVEVIV